MTKFMIDKDGADSKPPHLGSFAGPATSNRNIGPGCVKQYGADVHLRLHAVVTFLDDNAQRVKRSAR